ncbi:DNA-directed RNA polymerase subunit beta, partial [Vibrio parahaemolyticus]|nr:DNA-directed RNA polymerase subunit beta [Vibrio parahaemolyticus]
VTTLLRALTISSNAEIIDLLGETEELLRTLEKDTTTNEQEALLEIYKRLRPGEPPTIDSAKTLLNNLFFDPRRYDLAKVGRYKFNKKLSLYNRITDRKSAEDIIDPNTGEILVEKNEIISRQKAIEIENTGINSVNIMLDDGKVLKVLSNNFVSGEAFNLPFTLE